MKLSNQDIQDMKMLATDGYEHHAKYREIIMRIKDKLVDAQLTKKVTAIDFYRITSLMSTQMRAPLWEKYFIEKYKFNRVPPYEDRGDMEKNGNYYEYKASGFSNNGELRLLQIRPWQRCDYICQYISAERVDTFLLTKKQMRTEMEANKAHPAHGTKTANARNQNIEFMMTIPMETMKKKWRNEYLIADPLQIGV